MQQAMAAGVVPPVVDRKVLRERPPGGRPVAIEQARWLPMKLYHGKAIEVPPFQPELALW